MLRALKNRDYRLLWIGQGVSHVGDQFHLIALPWLVLALTHDPLQLGLVLALAGIPRAALMLVGGALADRYSPRSIMLASDIVRFALVAGLVAAIATGRVHVWMVYALALAFGTVSGVFAPAAEAALPRLVDDCDLESGNSLMMGVDQLASFVAPAAAGVLIALFGGAAAGGTRAATLTGIAVAMGVDAASFAVSALTLVFVRRLPGLGSRKTHPLHDIAEGLRFALGRPMLMWLMGFIALANLCVAGPMFVGIPVLAGTRFAEGATAFGLIISAYGIGNLVGMVGAGSLPRPSDRTFGVIAAALFLAFGVVIGSLALVSSMWLAVAMMAVVGVGNGYISVLVMTAVQRLTPERLLGRVMSLVMLAMFGLMPISQALAGVVLRFSPTALFYVAGAGLLLTSVLSLTQIGVWEFPAEGKPTVSSADDADAAAVSSTQPA